MVHLKYKEYVLNVFHSFSGVSHYNSDITGHATDHLLVSCQDKFGTSNLVQSFEED